MSEMSMKELAKARYQNQTTELPYLHVRTLNYESPAYEDDCGHGATDFVGSATYWSFREEAWETVDVYVYDTERSQKVCIRTGSFAGDYTTPGTVLDTMFAASRYKEPEYVAAARLIDWKFRIRAERR